MEFKHIVIFDDDCLLCQGLVKFIINQDNKDLFGFASLQSKAGQRFLDHSDLTSKYKKTVIFISEKSIYFRSTAVIKILMGLGGIYHLAKCLYIIPKFIRDSLYNLIAKHRFKIFGKSDSCFLITDNIRHKFL